MIEPTESRPLIEMQHGQVVHNRSRTKVVFRSHLISIGCTDISPEAARYILSNWEKEFGNRKQVIVFQDLV